MTGAEGDPPGRLDYAPAVGDLVVLRRPHPCGAERMAITAVGLDVRLSCTGCGALLMLSRERLRSRLREVVGTLSDLGGGPAWG